MSLAIVVFAYLLSQFYRAFLAAIASDLARDLALSPAELGSLPAMFLLAFALVQFPVGFALDRFGPSRTLVGFMISAVLGAIWLAEASRYGEALAAMALIGVGCAPVLMAGLYLAARSYPIDRFGTISSLMIGIGSLGDPLSSAPLALAAARFGWRPTMLAIAGLTALCALAALALRDPERVGPAGSGSASLISGLAQTLRRRDLWPLFPVAFVSYAVVVAIRGLWISPYLEQVHGLDAVTRSFVALAMGLAMAAGILLYIPVQRWLGAPEKAVAIGMTLTAMGCVALGLVGAVHVGLAVLLLMVIGIVAMSYAMVMTHARALLPAHLLGRGVTLLNFLFMIGAGTAQWLSGRLVQAAEHAGWTPPWTFGALFLCFAAALVAALIPYCSSQGWLRRPG